MENFRIVQAEKCKVVHVDISLPMKLEKKESEIRKTIEDKIFKMNQEYRIMIKFKIMINHRRNRRMPAGSLKQ